MTESTAPGGVPAAATRLLGSLTRHLQALLALAGLEAREATLLYVRLAIVLGGALFFAAFGYVFTLLFVAFALDRLLHIDWMWIALGFAIFHLLLALGGGFYVKKNCRTPVFRGIAEEIRKDVAALRGTQTTPTP
jgi:uncharacterized membrane protein YqjE